MAKKPLPSTALFQRIPLPSRLIVPLPLQIGERLHVKPAGTAVAGGESLIAHRAENEPAALAPVAGRIVGTTRARLLSDAIVDAVVIDTTDAPQDAPVAEAPSSSGDQAVAPHPLPHPLLVRSAEFGRWIDRLLAAGVAADRVSSPNFVGQLYQCLSRPIDTVLCCVLDSDPNTPLNAAVALAFASELAAGVDLLAKLTGARRVWVVADPAMSGSWFGALDPLVRADGLRLAPLRGDYPQTHPTLLLHSLLRRRLRPDRLPVEQGVLLFDAFTAITVGRVAEESAGSAAMLEVPLVLRDHVARRTHLLRVPIGISVAGVCAAIGLPSQEVQLRAGDFLRDQSVPDDAIVSAAGELTLHLTTRELAQNPDPCIRCGWCIEACPVRIHPAGLLEAAQRNDPVMAEHFGIDACIECGICSYVCPSRLPLLPSIRGLKKPTVS